MLQQKPEGASRVVLVEFPHPGLRAIGFVMRSFTDTNTGEEIAAVYVPTAPNPTSGYLQFVGTKNLLPADMSMDQAMTMILSGGATTPDHISLAARAPDGAGKRAESAASRRAIAPRAPAAYFPPPGPA